MQSRQTAGSTTIPAAILDRLVRGNVAANLLLVIGASVFVAMAAQIAVPIPYSPVPLTLQPLAVIMVGAALGSTRGAAALALYLLEGASGMPVFAQGHGGMMWLLAPTAGYLFSYPFAAWIAGRFSERGWTSHVATSVAAMLTALIVIYAGGWSWLALLAGPKAALSMGIVPFVVADIVKIALGAMLLPRAQRLVATTAE